MPPPMPLLRSGSPYSFGSQPSAASNFANAGRSASTRILRVVDLFGQPPGFEDQRADLGHVDEEAEVLAFGIVVTDVAHETG